MSQQPLLHSSPLDQTTTILTLEGALDVEHWADLKETLSTLQIKTPNVILDCQKIYSMDTFGAWQVSRFWKNLLKEDKTLSFQNCTPEILESLEELRHFSLPQDLKQELIKKPPNPIEKLGKKTIETTAMLGRMLSFLGSVIVALGHSIRHPSSFRFRSFVRYLEETGVKALPIIALVSLLIGVVLVYQGVSQLQRFGAEIFTVNLLAVSVLRELGILLTAIVVAGRSGSAFTAQIGFMKLNQELDAMKVLGLNPMTILVIPRIVALMVALPLLTIFCDLIAIIGGGLMSMQLIDLSASQFLTQLQSAITPSTFWVGMIKAPVFAFIIALIGCYEGLRVSGGAESVGRRTTKSVVQSIFMVIVLNAFFSVLFSTLEV